MEPVTIAVEMNEVPLMFLTFIVGLITICIDLFLFCVSFSFIRRHYYVSKEQESILIQLKLLFMVVSS